MKTRVTMMVFLVAAFVCSAAPAQQSPATPSAGTGMGMQDAKATELKMAMRKLWEDHITYTRNYIISALANLPDADSIAKRLLRNQEDIGNAIKPYYGDPAGQKLTALLKDHILIAPEVVKAAKAGAKAPLDAAQKKWSANGKDIAAFLSGANADWPKQDLEAML